jgi:hypothetical protein
MSLSSTAVSFFHILDFVREYPLFVNLLFMASDIVEIELDSIVEVNVPGQAARQCERSLLIENKTANLMMYSNLRPWKPFLIFYLVYCKSLPLKRQPIL